jgi:hypothetical protein
MFLRKWQGFFGNKLNFPGNGSVKKLPAATAAGSKGARSGD